MEIEYCFYHELALHPTALFKDGEMRTRKNKSALKYSLLEGVKPIENKDSKIITDECTLLQSCNWTKGEKFCKIFDMYIDRYRKFNLNRDATHKARSNKMSQIVEISNKNAWLLDEADSLTNYTNKQSFVNLFIY